MENANGINESTEKAESEEEKAVKVTQDESTVELLKKILESTEKETKYAKRAARFTIGIFLVLAIAMAIVIPKVVVTLTNVDAAVLKADDTMVQAQAAIDNINTMSNSITETSKNMNTMLGDNSDALTDAVKKMSNIDFEGLNKAIQDLQDAVGPFATFMNKFK